MLLRLIPTRTHGHLDYIVGILLIVAPWAFGFAEASAITFVPMAIGVATIFYSILTDYECSLAHAIPMVLHLIFDAAGGFVLLLSPWIFGFSNRVMLPHVTLGAMEIIVVLLSSSVPGWHLEQQVMDNEVRHGIPGNAA